MEVFLNGELATSEFLVTCLNELLVLLGPSADGAESDVWPTAVPLPGEGDVGFDPMEGLGEASRLFICSGDHPLAEEEMMLSRAARDAALGVE